jgi:hypothetical protein
MFNERKKLEDMSIDELKKEMSRVHKKTKFNPKKVDSDEDGVILLNPNNPSDKEWYENDEEHDVL